MGLPKDAEIAHWWKIQCSKCIFRSELKNGALTDGTCNYIFIMKHSRGCDMQNCERFSQGKRIRQRVDLTGKRRPTEKKEDGRRLPVKTPSRCACGPWLDEMLRNISLRGLTDRMDISYDHFCKWRNRPGAVMSDHMAEEVAKVLGVEVEKIRREEARYAAAEGSSKKTG